MSKIKIIVVVNIAAAIEAIAAGAFVVATHGGDAVHSDDAAAAALAAYTHQGRVLVVFRIERDDKEGLAWARQNCAYVFDVGGRHQDDDKAVVLDHHFIGLEAPEPARRSLYAHGVSPDKASGKDYQPVVDAASGDQKLHLVPFSSAGLLFNRLQDRGHRLSYPIWRVVRQIDAADNGVRGVAHGVTGLPESIALAVHRAAPVPMAGGSVSVDEVSQHFVTLAEAFLDLFDGDCSEAAAAKFSAKMVELAAAAEAGRAASTERCAVLIEAAAGPVLVLDQYEASALDCLGKAAETSPVLYLVFPSGGQWMVQQAPVRPMPCFDGKKPLPEAWAGLRDAEFQEATGVEDGIFCHPGRFICGAKSREGAMRLARMAVEA